RLPPRSNPASSVFPKSRALSSISSARPSQLDCFDGEHPHTLLFLTQAAPNPLVARAELPTSSQAAIHGRPWHPPCSAATPVRKPQDRTPSPSSLSSRALSFENGGRNHPRRS